MEFLRHWALNGHNFVATMLRAGRDRDRLTVVDDQRGGPTPAGAIAAALITMARGLAGDAAAGRGADAGKTGIFHFAGAPAVSWCGFAREIFAQTGWEKVPEIAPIRAADWPTPAIRPANSVLECSRIERAWGIGQPDWRAALGPVISELQGGG